MEDIKSKNASRALPAGTAEGLGEAYSVSLAQRGLNIILVEHQKQVMEDLS